MLTETYVLRAVTPDVDGAGGPTYRTVLEALAEHHGAADGAKCITDLIHAGKLIQYGKKRCARWGLPKPNQGTK
jgi:hypothetical protein